MQSNTFKIYTDSGCDIPPALLEDWGVACESLTFRFNDSEQEYANGDMPTKEFYQKMRDGGVAKTAAINTETFAHAFSKALDEGLDVLYIGFSSGISNTFNAGRLAAEELRVGYPDRKIIAIDSLCASAGEGLLVYLAVLKAREGATLEEVAAYVENIRPQLCHWFTVDNLVYLKRGGRVSPTTALIGNTLHIKPVMHVDNAGKLINVSKVRGRKAAVDALFEKTKASAIPGKNDTMFISHGDCIADAEYLAARLKNELGVKHVEINYVGPVIGAHSGPGTLAVFYLGNER